MLDSRARASAVRYLEPIGLEAGQASLLDWERPRLVDVPIGPALTLPGRTAGASAFSFALGPIVTFGVVV